MDQVNGDWNIHPSIHASIHYPLSFWGGKALKKARKRKQLRRLSLEQTLQCSRDISWHAKGKFNGLIYKHRQNLQLVYLKLGHKQLVLIHPWACTVSFPHWQSSQFPTNYFPLKNKDNKPGFDIFRYGWKMKIFGLVFGLFLLVQPSKQSEAKWSVQNQNHHIYVRVPGRG